MYPTAKQAARLESVSERHRVLYNAALEHRISAYRREWYAVEAKTRELAPTQRCHGCWFAAKR